MYKLSNWDLKDLYPNQQAAEKDLLLLEKKTVQFTVHKKHLSSKISPIRFMKLFKEGEVLDSLATKISAYAQLDFYTHINSSKARAFKDKVSNKLAELSTQTLFFSLWFKDLSDSRAQHLISGSGKYQYHLSRMRDFKPYTLSEPEEKIITLKDTTGDHALLSLYSLVTNALRFPLKLKGKKKILNQSEITPYFRHENPKIREAAYQSLLSTYQKQYDVFGEIYKNLVLSWKNEHLLMRKYSSVMAVRNLGNDVSDKAVETMLHVCEKKRTLFQKYFHLKAKLLKTKKLSRYHLYAPLHVTEGRWSLDRAMELVFSSFSRFSPRMAQEAEKVLAANHLDSIISDSKRSGAFCYSTLTHIIPYVLVNYTGKERDVSTIAHELGHAVHSLLAKEQTDYTFHAPLVLAETASVFGEMLLMERLLQEEKDKKKKQAKLVSHLDNIYATVLRQTFFVLFELQAHEKIAQGATVDEVSQLYLHNLQEQFGSAVSVPPEFKVEWTYIPHVYETPFYCYSYAFGNLLVLSLYEKYKEQGPSFVPKYLALLSAGGSEKPAKLLAKLGIDIESEKFWEGGFALIEEMIKELEELSE